MLSRRNIRIKVMQMLYGASRDSELTYDQTLDRFRKSVDQTYGLYLYSLYYLVKVAEYAMKDAERRSSKHLPTEEDKAFTGKLFLNDSTHPLYKNDKFQSHLSKRRYLDKIDPDLVRRLYTEYAKTDSYKAYLSKADEGTPDQVDALLQLFKICSADESFNEAMEDLFATWIDDKSLVVGAIKKTLKALPVGEDFCDTYEPDEETVKGFGEELLRKVFQEDRELLEIIEPTLKNWDADRVAALDMILLKMALCELLIFPTIPTKVTLNEFVEISKRYSTEKSKDFINGILDRLMKQLNKDGKIKKEGRGLLE